LFPRAIAYDIRNALTTISSGFPFDYHEKMNTAQLMSAGDRRRPTPVRCLSLSEYFVPSGSLSFFVAAGALLFALNWQLTLVSFRLSAKSSAFGR